MKIIKRERQVRLDELLKYVWDNDVKEEEYVDQDGNLLFIEGEEGHIRKADYTCKSDLFTITEEVEIDEETPINLVYRIKTEKGWQTFDKNETPINRIINTYKRHPHAYLGFIYLQNPDGSIGELIWSKERGLID